MLAAHRAFDARTAGHRIAHRRRRRASAGGRPGPSARSRSGRGRGECGAMLRRSASPSPTSSASCCARASARCEAGRRALRRLRAHAARRASASTVYDARRGRLRAVPRRGAARTPDRTRDRARTASAGTPCGRRRLRRVAAARGRGIDSARRGSRHRRPSSSRARARRSSTTSPTSPTTRSSPTTSWSTGTSRARTPTASAPARASASRRRCNRFPWGDVDDHRGRAARAGSSRSGRTGKYNRIRTLGVYELEPAPGGAPA